MSKESLLGTETGVRPTNSVSSQVGVTFWEFLSPGEECRHLVLMSNSFKSEMYAQCMDSHALLVICSDHERMSNNISERLYFHCN